MLIGQLLVFSAGGISGKDGDNYLFIHLFIFLLCKKVTELRLQPCDLSVSFVDIQLLCGEITHQNNQLLLFNRHSGPLVQLAVSNELIEICFKVFPFMSLLRESV